MTASANTTHLWDGGAFTPLGDLGCSPIRDASPGVAIADNPVLLPLDDLALMVADSWRSSDGAVADYEAHCHRFEHSVSRMRSGGNLLTVQWDRFWEHVARTVLRAHEELDMPELFPRISLRGRGADEWQGIFEQPSTDNATGSGTSKSRVHASGSDVPDDSLLLEIRPAPPLRPFTTLTHLSLPDPRRHPSVKGPDLGRLSRARSHAVALGFDDLLLCDHDGTVLETCTGSLLWWDGATAVFPKRRSRILPSITADQVRRRLIREGTPVCYDDVAAEDLRGHPLWFVNSLHGISPVTSLVVDAGEVPVGRHPQEGAWQRWWLESRERPLPG